MSYKKIIPYINAENEEEDNVFHLAKEYSYGGADELLIYNFTKDDEYREQFLSLCKVIAKEIDITFIIGLHVERVEDIKKALYTGASCVLIDYKSIDEKDVIKNASVRFGTDNIMLALDFAMLTGKNRDEVKDFSSLGVGKVMLKDLVISSEAVNVIDSFKLPVLIKDSLTKNNIKDLLLLDSVFGVASNFYKGKDLMKEKHRLKDEGLPVNIFESKLSFSELQTNDQGLIPVITQDYKSDQVLMLAYMNKEAYNETIASGRMTYYSRSRKSLWVKGEVSGHYQYLKKLSIDCDNDTLLAKVVQVGAACHTGNQSCFYTNLIEKESKNTDSRSVFEDIYNVINNRKKNPKEGSYTNYLFDKGIDKILKKCGEESTEIIIAAKNPETEELKYEIADYLYHLMVLMVEQGIDWNDITTELEHRK